MTHQDSQFIRDRRLPDCAELITFVNFVYKPHSLAQKHQMNTMKIPPFAVPGNANAARKNPTRVVIVDDHPLLRKGV